MMEETVGHKLVVSDGVFSMDGDVAALVPLAQLCTTHDALLMIDDAHGFGVLGSQGRGSVTAAGLNEEQVPVLMGTLGKAAGTSGAFVAGPAWLTEYLVQKARTYIYTTAMPPALAQANCNSLRLIESFDPQRAHLAALIGRFRDQVARMGYHLMPSATPIQPIVVGSNEAALTLSAELQRCGLLVTAIRPPTVPEGQARLRITLSAAHSFDDLDRLLQALVRCRPDCVVSPVASGSCVGNV
jgi:8-amino-7-oxononanoate synthase